jgi:lantibiotic biosynthesis protein
MAHGAAGILAFLSLAALDGRTVDGQHAAINDLCTWFSRWRQESTEGTWWPQWLTRDDLRSGYPCQPRPRRPSWCYGATGIARALQLAALATGDPHHQREAEDALVACFADSQLARITSVGLCHGIAGVYQTATRAAADALSSEISRRLPGLAAELASRPSGLAEPGVLTGNTGTRLVLETVGSTTAPRSGWDACLLIT